MNELIQAKLQQKNPSFLNDVEQIQAQFTNSFPVPGTSAQSNKLKELNFVPPPPLKDLPKATPLGFYLLEIVEEPSPPHNLTLTGRVNVNHLKPGAPAVYKSIKIKVKNVMREFYVIPRREHSAEQVVEEISQQINSKRTKADMKSDLQIDVVPKKYCFEYVVDLRGAQRDVVRVRYPFRYPALTGIQLEGETYSGIFGMNYTALELFQLRNKTQGPGWYELRNIFFEGEDFAMEDEEANFRYAQS